MGGTSCSRCSGVMEDCTTKCAASKYGSVWSECGGPLAPQVHMEAPSMGERIQGPTNPSSGTMTDQVVEVREIEVGLTTTKFAVSRGASGSSAKKAYPDLWSSRYTVGRELGSGQTAVVYEASAKSSSDATAQTQGRKVALKRFNRSGTSMFRQEVRALRAAFTHPFIVRLLEIYEHGDEDDALILEYCGGGDLYELYARNKGCAMPEPFVAHLLRQLLSALRHLTMCRVDHRDVKPENLLLYGRQDDAYPCLKLSDFGWAVVVLPHGPPPTLPAEGVGSLWYAPPELNPPVPGMESVSEAPLLGRSDMWSVGVIAYLLLVGHSPFNQALRASDPVQTEKQVIHLAAKGDINKNARAWPRLSAQAQSFITALVRPQSRERPLPSEALQHPFIIEGCSKVQTPQSYPELVTLNERKRAWTAMDGFQRLCWLAIAKAVSETELLDARSSRAFTFQQYGLEEEERMTANSYLEYLASELMVIAVPSWFQSHAGWADVMHLAFRYLDIDSDGVLDADDLQAHVYAGERETIESWIVKWHRPQPNCQEDVLGIVDFRWTLWSTCIRRVQNVIEDSHPYDSDRFIRDGMPAGRARAGGEEQEQMALKQMKTIDEVCERYIDEVLYPETDLRHEMTTRP